jgi:hypothetical protein
VEVDDIIFMCLWLSVAWVVYAFRRHRDLTSRIEARRNAELEARNLARHDP